MEEMKSIYWKKMRRKKTIDFYLNSVKIVVEQLHHTINVLKWKKSNWTNQNMRLYIQVSQFHNTNPKQEPFSFESLINLQLLFVFTFQWMFYILTVLVSRENNKNNEMCRIGFVHKLINGVVASVLYGKNKLR